MARNGISTPRILPPSIVGRVWFAAPNGHVFLTAMYPVPHTLRDAVLTVDGGYYRQSRQEPNGTFVYRYEGPTSDPKNSPHLTEFRDEYSAEWDGPRPAPPKPTLRDVYLSLDALHAQGFADALDLRALSTLLESL